MFYQGEPEASVDVAAVEEVEQTTNPCPPQRNQISDTNDPDVIVISDTQPISTNTIENAADATSTTPSSRKRTR